MVRDFGYRRFTYTTTPQTETNLQEVTDPNEAQSTTWERHMRGA